MICIFKYSLLKQVDVVTDLELTVNVSISNKYILFMSEYYAIMIYIYYEQNKKVKSKLYEIWPLQTSMVHFMMLTPNYQHEGHHCGTHAHARDQTQEVIVHFVSR